jgi:hypothetical protein
MKSFFHNLIPFLPFLLNRLRLPTLSILIPLLPSSCLGRLASRNSTNSKNLLCPSYNPSARTTKRTRPLYCWEGVFTALLRNNGSYLIVPRVFVPAGMCLPRSCLPMDVSSDFIIPAFGRHVTIFYSTPRNVFFRSLSERIYCLSVENMVFILVYW